MPIQLASVAQKIRGWCEERAARDAPYGTYHFSASHEPNFYASADIAIIRWITGEDLKTELTPDQRQQWADAINSHQNPVDGRYGPEMGHHIFHANGTATNALCILEHKYRHPVKLYEIFNTPERVGPWLTQIPWRDPWGDSHLVWGGPALWINSQHATDAWKNACFDWFDWQLNEFGSWPREFPTDYTTIAPHASDTHSNRMIPLGCAVHVWPLYRHTGREVPGLEALADHVIDWQNSQGYWDQIGNYGTMDALYVLAVAIQENLPHKSVYEDALRRYLPLHMDRGKASWITLTAHNVLGWASCIGYLQRGLPDEFTHETEWGDIFDREAIYKLDTVMI
jgi:hypothetical protein